MRQPFAKSNLIDTAHGFYGRAGYDEATPVLLKQVHGITCLTVTDFRDDKPEADASVTNNPDITLGIVTADCAPVLFSSPGVIGAAHAGWGGALKGVLESTLDEMEKLGAKREEIAAAIGPCIAKKSYEVSMGFEAPFLSEDHYAERFFQSGAKPDKLMFDLAGYCAYRLARAGVPTVDIIGHDTLTMENAYFSHRRGTIRGEKETGRQISVISLKSS